MIGKSQIKQKINNSELVISSMLRFPDPALLEVIALSGVGLVTIDYEHYPFNEETLIHLARAADAHNIGLIARVPNAEPERIARILDMGIDGIHLPSVETYEEALGLVHAVKFSPIGKRGFCPITRAASYGLSRMSWEEYAEYSNQNTIIVVQIETISGVKNLDQILSIPEIDIVAAGPSDMAASLGIPGKNDDPRVKKAIEEVYTKAKQTHKHIFKKASTPEEMKVLRASGVNLVGISSDQQILMAGYRAMVEAAK